MINRPFWQKQIEFAWKERNVIWLSGVRRVGKTCLCQSLDQVEYMDCELPRVRRMLHDPESFLENMKGRRIILDEIHRLDNPSEILKIAADHFRDTCLLATGSSTLGASKKIRDTLSGRKRDLCLTPILTEELSLFQPKPSLPQRLLRGGLPPFLLASPLPEKDFQEWMDAYWAKDIQELFRLQRRDAFQKFVELILAQSGGIFEAIRFARPCEVSRVTIANFLKVLESTHVASVLRPYNTHRSNEILSAPKVYAFDTGFVCYHKGWHDLRREDMGLLWEHLVLNELYGCLQIRQINYWRDKRGHEVDFILARRGQPLIAIECKWSANDLDSAGLQAFRRQYPEGMNYLVAQDVDRSFQEKSGGLKITVTNLITLIENLL